MQIKATLRFHLQSDWPRSIKHATAHADKGSGAGGKVTLRRWASERVQPLWDSLLTLPKKLGLDPPQDPAYPSWAETLACPRSLLLCTSLARKRKIPTCLSTDESMMKMGYIYTTGQCLAFNTGNQDHTDERVR